MSLAKPPKKKKTLEKYNSCNSKRKPTNFLFVYNFSQFTVLENFLLSIPSQSSCPFHNMKRIEEKTGGCLHTYILYCLNFLFPKE